MTTYWGKNAALYKGGTPLAYTDEPLHDSGNHTLYYVNDVTKRLIDVATAVVVQVDTGGGYATVTNYTLEPTAGIVTFNSANGASDTVRIHTGNYIPLSKVADATEWELSLESEVKDSSRLGDSWKSQVVVQLGGNGKFGHIYQDNLYLVDIGSIFTDTLYFMFYVDAANKHGYVARGFLKSNSVKVAVDDIITEDISFEATGKIVYWKY